MRGIRVALLISISFSLWSAETVPFEVKRNVMVAMRDGTELAANIFIPSGKGRFPVILMRTPYGKSTEKSGDAKLFTGAGYVLVSQDCRGKGDSKGTWEPFRYDPEDGFDTQEWVGKQPWCNGNIGTAGGSYVGWTQWASSAPSSKYLKAMVPVVPFGNPYHEILYQGGALQFSLAFGWGAGVGGIRIEPTQVTNIFNYLPLQSWDDQFGKDVFYLTDWTKHSTYDDYWKTRSINDRFEAVSVPVLNVGGWYDIFSKATVELIDQVRARATNQLVRRNQMVVMGPWSHSVGVSKVGEVDFGPTAKLDLAALQMKWFDYWLKNKNTGVEDWPAYRLFVMGENQWRDEHEWPIKRTRFTPYYLRSGGKANSSGGDGLLSTTKPANEVPDKYSYDGDEPVPTRGGNNLFGTAAGPLDQTELEKRSDILVFTSSPLEEAVEVTGQVKMKLFAATSAQDTDFTAKLVDVHPNGKAYNLCDGIVRARYRNSSEKTELIEGGKTYPYEIDLWVTSNLFKKGHRIRLQISSSNFPRFDRNPNSGKPFGTDTELLKAEQTIFHDAERPSHIVLPIIPRS